jgi:hypothetical protein
LSHHIGDSVKVEFNDENIFKVFQCWNNVECFHQFTSTLISLYFIVSKILCKKSFLKSFNEL